MRITVTRSGGFGGFRPQVSEVSTEGLDPHEAASLTALATSLPATPDTSPGADQYQYDITVENEGQTRSYQFHGEQSAARDLITRVHSIAHKPSS